jgi:hypothetical protein
MEMGDRQITTRRQVGIGRALIKRGGQRNMMLGYVANEEKRQRRANGDCNSRRRTLGVSELQLQFAASRDAGWARGKVKGDIPW